MRRYLEIRSVPALLEQLRAEGVVTKVQRRVSGPNRGGIPFRRGSLFYLLKNPVYRGKIVHKGNVHDGEHEAIVDEDLWERIQMQLRERSEEHTSELQSLMRISYAVFCLKKKKRQS